MDLSQFLIMEQSPFRLSKEMCLCHSSACCGCAHWQAEQQAKDVPLHALSLPATGRHSGGRGTGAVAPTVSPPATLGLAWRSQSACGVPPPPARSESSALPTLLQQESCNMYKTKSFSYWNLFFPPPEAFVSKQDASVWGERQWCGSAHAAKASWKWCNSWVCPLPPHL